MKRNRNMLFGFGLAQLAIDSQMVIAQRMTKLALGGPAAQREAVTMVAEKVATAQQAGLMLMGGKSAQSVLSLYRRKVAANRRRLS